MNIILYATLGSFLGRTLYHFVWERNRHQDENLLQLAMDDEWERNR